MNDDSIIGRALWTKEISKSVDKLSSESFLLPELVLMEAAGRGVADVVQTQDNGNAPIIIICGPGNNGGDGFVAARHLIEAGLDVTTILVAKPDATATPACKRQIAILNKLGHTPIEYIHGCLTPWKDQEAIVVDALIGIGFSGVLKKDSLAYEALQETADLSPDVIIAIDTPSGIDVDNANAQDIPLTADITVTFGGLKIAHAVAPARDLCGEIIDIDIGFPSKAISLALERHELPFVEIDSESTLEFNPWEELSPSAHKYDRGHVLVIGGSEGKTGAPFLSALAALRSGAGWVSVSLPPNAWPKITTTIPSEITFENLYDSENKLIPDLVQEFVSKRRVSAICIGPGMMESNLTKDFLQTLKSCVQAGCFLVIDAGATKGLEVLLENEPFLHDHVVLTPHPGEWRTMLDNAQAPLTPTTIKEVKAICEKLGVTILYKHATPVVVSPDPNIPGCVLTSGDFKLARAGSGDVLAGIIAAHGAIGMRAASATLRSYAVLTVAAEHAAVQHGTHSILASDIIDQLGSVNHDESQS